MSTRNLRERLLREPLLHFFVLGALVFAAARYFDSDASRYRIDAGPGQRARLETTYRQQYGVAPSAEQLQYLLNQYVRSEILFREGLAMGLDRDDEIVRRRVVQKIEFVNQDLDLDAEPEEAALVGYFKRHQTRYSAPPTVSFTQVYFSVDHDSGDRGGDAGAKARAEAALQALRRGEAGHDGVNFAAAAPATALGDNFSDGAEFSSVSASNAASLFGDSPFSAALFTVPANSWAGPFKSGYGWHLVRVTARTEPRASDFQSVKERVRSDYIAELRDQRNDEEFRKLAGKYRIVTDGSPT